MRALFASLAVSVVVVNKIFKNDSGNTEGKTEHGAHTLVGLKLYGDIFVGILASR